MKAIAWCNEPLEDHLFLVGLLAYSIYRAEAEYMEARHGVPAWTLALAGAFHDAGKAHPFYQEAAQKACNGGGRPSFYLHEYLSPLPLLAAAEAARQREPGLHAPLLVAAAAAALHHHGMTGRLTLLRDAMSETIQAGGKRAVLRSLALTLLDNLENTLTPALEALRRLQGHVAGLPMPDRILELAERGVKLYGGARNMLTRLGAYPDMLPTPRFPRGPGAYWASTTIATASVSLADTIVSSLSRSGRMGGYACRVLEENHEMLVAAFRALCRAGATPSGSQHIVSRGPRVHR